MQRKHPRSIAVGRAGLPHGLQVGAGSLSRVALLAVVAHRDTMQTHSCTQNQPPDQEVILKLRWEKAGAEGTVAETRDDA